MKKLYYMILHLVCLFFIIWMIDGYAEVLPEEREPIDYIEVMGTTGDGNPNGFIYSDSMLLEPSFDVELGYSTDLLKVSVALASAAYDTSSINPMIMDMGYYYTNLNYARRSIWDNDHVALTVGWKKPEGTDVTLWCIAVRGTPINSEWFSDFNLGKKDENNGDHQGFLLAADEAQASLDQLISWKGSGHNIFLFTGHSRGAAVANILAARYTARGETVYGYTFACPRVSKNANPNLSNIHNFNNTGDVITILPLEEWGYKRNGKTHEFAFSLAPVFTQRYKVENNGVEYGSTSDAISYELILKTIVPDEESFSDPMRHFLINVLAYALGGHNDCQWPDMLAKFGVDLAKGEWARIWDKIKTTVRALDIFHLFTNEDDDQEVERILDFLNDAIADVAGFGPEEVAEYISEHIEMISEVKDWIDKDINSLEDLEYAFSEVNAYVFKTKSIATIVGCILDICDNSGNAGSAIYDGHDHNAYVWFINSQYYGYNGRRGTSITTATIPNYIHTLGSGCFSGDSVK